MKVKACKVLSMMLGKQVLFSKWKLGAGVEMQKQYRILKLGRGTWLYLAIATQEAGDIV